MKHRIKKIALSFSVISALILPVGVYAATDSEDTIINASIGSTISITTSETVNISITPVSGGAQSSAKDTVTVATNNSNGYRLTLESATSSTDLESGSNTIAAHTGTFTSPTPLANNTWGYRINNEGGFGSGSSTPLDNSTNATDTYAGINANGTSQEIIETNSTTSGDQTEVWYSVKADTSKPNGTYTSTVTYTATTKN